MENTLLLAINVIIEEEEKPIKIIGVCDPSLLHMSLSLSVILLCRFTNEPSHSATEVSVADLP